MRKFEIADKVVIVTGAASGIGCATARAFLEAGARVALIDIDAELLEAQARTLSFAFPKDRVVHLPCDVTVDEEVERSIDAVVARWGAIHVLINDAAVVTAGRFENHDPERMRRTVLVNLYAPMHLCQRVIPHMKAAGEGHIVNVYSGSAGGGVPGYTAYGGSKAGLAGFSRVLRRELLDKNITVTLLCPGMTRTPVAARSIERMPAFGARAHDAEVPAEAIVRATRDRTRYVGVSDPPVVPRVIALADAFFPGLMDRLWFRFATPRYFDAIAVPPDPADPD